MQPLLDQNGRIKKNDFIEYCIQVKLLDLVEKNKEGKPDKEEKLDSKKEKKKQVRPV